ASRVEVSAEAGTSDQATVAAGAKPSGPVKDWTGREIAGRYRVLERLGEGGMGVVYVAEHVTLKKKVAFKVIHPELAKHEDLMLRFQREALATGQLDHPHIAAAIDFGELEGGGAFMVMPWVRGHSLQAELDSHGRMDFRRASQLCAQIADALSAAHAMGIVHRDLKPDNVLLEKRSDGSEAAKVLDFGVASLAGRPEGLSVDARPLTQAGTILGTPGYMSPEQASAGDVDHRTDIYALGVILWELCRGERLFSGDDITQIFAKQFKSVPAALELGLSSSARELSQLVTRMLAWDKSARPGTAAEVRDTLRRIAAQPDTRLPSLRIPVVDHPVLQKVPLPGALEPYRGYVPHALVMLLLLIGILAWRGSREEGVQQPALVEAPPYEAAKTKASKEEPKQAEAKQPEPEKEPERARAPEPEPERKPEVEAPPGASARLQSDMQEALDHLLNARAQNSRRTAAKWLLKVPNVPRYIALMAEMELNGRCADKKEVVDRMRTLGDPRVLPALERLSEAPRRGCGFFRMYDCNACLRKELEQTIGALRENKD
ncbi:MAG TPA: serine/threonine-protein kinase, partial [Polyangiales bacterium]